MAAHTTGLKLRCGTTAFKFLIIAITIVTTRRATAADPFARYDLAMLQRPQLRQVEHSDVYPSGLLELWLKALDRPDAELQRLVIDTLAIAHVRGLEGMNKATPRLLELSQVPGQRLDVLRSIAQTLVILDARDQTEVLKELASKHGLSIAKIVEPALAAWKSAALRDAWLQRVEEAEVGQTMMTLAIDGLAQLRAIEASEPLQSIVRNPGQTVHLRMTSAHALGQIHESGLVDLAEDLIGQTSRPAELHPILAVQLMNRHTSTEAVETLNGLVGHESTIVQAAALERLYEIDTSLVDPFAARMFTSPDVNVRRWCARAMIAEEDAGRIQLLSTLLSDVNPGLRREVAAAFIELAEKPDLRGSITDHTMEVLNMDDWRGCEQACWILARLDHRPSGTRMVELLGHNRGEVQVASAWGLTQLRMEELLPDMLEHAQSVYDGFRSGQLNDRMPGMSLHVAHLFNAFGDQKYEPANQLMRRYLPKDFSLGLEARPAAAWALGMIYQNEPQDDLVTILVERLNDGASMEPETDEMRSMCAISLGLMKAESAMESLRKNAPGLPACYWAIERITGEPMPAADSTVRHEIGGWFLAPIRDQGVAE